MSVIVYVTEISAKTYFTRVQYFKYVNWKYR